MSDIDLWEQLLAGGLPPLRALLELSELRFEERVPYFGLLEPSLQQAELKAAALRVLAGADYIPTLSPALDDSDEAVREAALHSLLASVVRDPARWVHAAFHPNPLVRARAATLANTDATRQFNLASWDEPAAVANLPSQVQAAMLPIVSELVAVGHVPLERARSWMTGDALKGLTDPALDTIVGLFWDASQGRFWTDRLSELTAKRRESERDRWVRAVLRKSATQEGPPEAMWLAVALAPDSLHHNEVAERSRRAGLEGLYRTQIRTLTDKELEGFFALPFCQDPWALGALMQIAEQPYRFLEKVLPLPQLAEFLCEHPGEAAWLFLAHDSRKDRLRILRALGAGPELAAALLLRDPEQAADTLEAMTVEQLGALLDQLAAMENRLGPRVTPIAGVLARRMLPELDKTLPLFAKATCVARACLAAVADLAGAERFVQAATPEIREAIDACAGFPHGVLLLLANQWSTHFQSEVREWAQKWLPQAQETGSLPARRGAHALTALEGTRIREATLDELPSLLPQGTVTGLVEALQRPAAPLAEVCVALLGCHDPLPAVAAEWERWTAPGQPIGGEFWLHQKELPLQANAWLSRWDSHRDAVAATLENSPARLAALARTAYELPSPTLAEELWGCLGRIASVWLFRDSQRLRTMVSSELMQTLLQALPGPSGKQVAVVLLRIHQAAPDQAATVREAVVALLPDLSKETREMLSAWIASQGLTGTQTRRSKGKHETLPDSLEELETWAAGDDPGQVEAAALRLLELQEFARLAPLLRMNVRHAAILAETVGLWPDGPALNSLAGLSEPPEAAFWIALRTSDSEGLYRAVCAIGPWWFEKRHWECCLLVYPVEEVAARLVRSPQPHAYRLAVEFWLLQQKVGVAHLENFLRAGRDRLQDLRLQVARCLAGHGSAVGYPLLLAEFVADPEATMLGLWEMPQARAGALALLQHGNRPLLRFLEEMPRPIRHELAPMILRHSTTAQVCTVALAGLARSLQGSSLVQRVAQAFAWGVLRGRELTGRLFQVQMHGGEALGFTYHGSSKIHVNPLPMLRGEQHGEEIVKGLMLHEYGHHVYHADRGPWDQARAENLGQLFNLVADEHLERNLRERDSDWGDKLKRLAAYAFQHSQREMSVWGLVGALGMRAAPVLRATRLQVARRQSCVKLSSRHLLSELERNGSSFARFLRALRMGLGNRSGDARVAQALKLFDRRFRHSDMTALLVATRQLRDIFGSETDILTSFDSELEEWVEILARGEGLDQEELQREIERILSKGGARGLNLRPEEEFPPLNVVQTVPFDPVLHTEYAREVARPARRMREYLERLGLKYQPQRRRLQGLRVDRPSLPRALLVGDPRVLVARQLRYETDLFVGLLVDCSGSMAVGNEIQKARLFATLLAESARGLGGIDVRIFGFTSEVLYDAGSGERCAAHSLESGGGNNDAGALAYVASLAMQSRRRARLLVMISDGLPTDCSVAALKALVDRLTRRHRIACAQVAVRPLEHICFPHYSELSGELELATSVAQFGRIVAGLIRKTLGAP